MSKVCVVATYYNRQEQLSKTLHSLSKSNHKDFEVIIVDDCSPEDVQVFDLPYPIEIIKLKDKTWHNTANVYNIGLLKALEKKPDIIIIQNAECFHAGDVISYAERVTDQTYIAFGCYSLAKGEEPIEIRNDKGAVYDGESAWYNHPVHRPVGYHFCSAITTKNLIKINGFDERFSDGIAYEDNYLVHQIGNLGLAIEIPVYPFVFHQYHYDGMNRDVELIKKNAELYNSLKEDGNFRAVHTLTPDL